MIYYMPIIRTREMYEAKYETREFTREGARLLS